jgi:hypothetical protein
MMIAYLQKKSMRRIKSDESFKIQSEYLFIFVMVRGQIFALGH